MYISTESFLNYEKSGFFVLKPWILSWFLWWILFILISAKIEFLMSFAKIIFLPVSATEFWSEHSQWGAQVLLYLLTKSPSITLSFGKTTSHPIFFMLLLFSYCIKVPRKGFVISRPPESAHHQYHIGWLGASTQQCCSTGLGFLIRG